MLWLVWMLACDDNATKVDGFGVSPFPNNGGGGGNVVGDTWPDVKAIFESNCYTCHGSGSLIGPNLDLETDGCTDIVGVASQGYEGTLVTPGDHTTSLLWHKVNDDGAAGPVMPAGGKMAATNIDTIAAWIDAGASCEEGTNTTPTYGINDVQKVFDTYCIVCHVYGGEGSPPLDLTDAYTALLDGDKGIPSIYASEGAGNLVDRRHPETSFLMRKLSGEPLPGDGRLGVLMPKDANRLPTDKIATVFGWILDGAKDE